MKKITKVLSVLMAAVMLMTALCVPASAASIESTAVKISSGKTYSTSLNSPGAEKNFKISVNKNGYLDLQFISTLERVDVTVYDSDGNKQTCIKESVKTGEADNNTYYSWDNGCVFCYWNRTFEKFSGTLRYEVKKGVYYIQFERITGGNENDLSITATFPSSSSSSSAKISYLSIEVPKGSKMQLAAVVSAKTSASVSWSSSKSSVVSVNSKGKITAKAKGSAVITAKLGSSTMKIRIKVV